jgi:hypothetical protein
VFVKGRPEDVTVDDLYPIYNNIPAFVKPTVDEYQMAGGGYLFLRRNMLRSMLTTK